VARVSAKQTALMIRFARAAEQRRKAGDLGQVELDVAQLAAADAGLEQARADEALLRARRAMTALTGGEHADWPAVPEQLPDVDPQQLQVQRLLDSLPSMRAARARVATARATIRSRVRHTRPDPTVGLRVGEEDSQTLTGVTLSVPLFVRNSFRAEVDAASAELVQAEREAATLRQQARADLIAAAQIYENARSAWKHWQIGGAPRLSGATDLLERLWQTGELSLTDYLVQLKQALDSERSAAEQRGHVWRSWADWLAASGQSDQWLILPGDTP
jgi:cobalt-zinc-cadmium efflux system outer membrane protein